MRCKAGPRCKEEAARSSSAAMNYLVILRLRDDVEHLVDLSGLELTGTAEILRNRNEQGSKCSQRGTTRHMLATACEACIPLVNVDASLLAGEGGKAAAKTTDGSEGERDLTTT